MKVFKCNVIDFFELSDEWQREAKSNLDEYAEESSYLEPDEAHNPKEHILKDLTEAMKATGTHEGFEYNATIGISNNSAMLINFNADMSEAEYIYV